jgi:protein SCO1
MATSAVPASRRLRGPHLLAVIVGIVLVIMIPTVFLPTVLFPPKPPQFTDDLALPDFTLTDHTGARLTRDDLRGHVTIVNFIFTRCDTVCPVTSMKMRTVQERTGDEPAIKLVSISVDPAHDTVPILAAYAAKLTADPTRWRFARGDIGAVRALVEGAMAVGFDDLGNGASGVPNITHSAHFVLLDRNAHLRGYYDSDDWARIETLMRHARWLVRRS